MKRLGRIIFNSLTVLLLLLALATAAAWGRSYWRRDEMLLVGRDKRTLLVAALGRGKLELGIIHADTPGFWTAAFPEFLGYHSTPTADGQRLSHTFVGFSWEEKQVTYTYNKLPVVSTAAAAAIPDAYLLALFAALPATRLYRRVRRWRLVRVGHCLSCGYDLRATPDRCPECGTVPTKATQRP